MYLTDEEIKQRYTEQNEGVKAMVAAVPPTSFLPRSPPPAKLKSKAGSSEINRSSNIPEKQTISYVFASPSQIKERHEDRRRPGEGLLRLSPVRVFHPCLPAPRQPHPDPRWTGGPRQGVEAARKKIQEIAPRPRPARTFATLARENNQDSSSASGGDLGWLI